MKTGKAPAFYALGGTSQWKDYVNILHIPYTLWHLSYVVMGAALAPSIHVDRLLGTLLAFFLAVGVGSHALDELNGRPLGTRVPRRHLLMLAIVSLTGAVILGTVAAYMVSWWTLPFVAFGAFIAVAYNLGLWGDWFHSDFWFAAAWGAFPAITSYWIQSPELVLAPVLLACGCFTLSLAQRTLSTQARTIRRKTLDVRGSMEMADGSVKTIDVQGMIVTPERTLRLLFVTTVVFAATLFASRL